MRWIGISGSWRNHPFEVEQAVRADVQQIFSDGDAIVTGGALGVDFTATDEALKLDPTAARIKVILPTCLEIYAAHYRQRAKEDVITAEQAETLIAQLVRLGGLRSASLLNIGRSVVDKRSYADRNGAVVSFSDALYAYQVNGSEGVQDTIDRAHRKGLPVVVRSFNV